MSNIGWFECAEVRGVPDIWTPARIPTSLWLDASDDEMFTLATDKVSLWKDKSGNGNSFQQDIDSMRPVRTNMFTGKKIVSFALSQILTCINLSLFSNIAVSTLFCVTRAGNNNLGESMYLCACTNTPGYARFGFSHGTVAGKHSILGRNTESGSIGKVNGTVSIGTTPVISVGIADYLANMASLQLNGSVDTNTSAFTGTLATTPATASCDILLGGYYSGSAYSQMLTGDIHEIILCNYAVPIQTADRVVGYLAHKWGLN